jgi:hypothetical protein
MTVTPVATVETTEDDAPNSTNAGATPRLVTSARDGVPGIATLELAVLAVSLAFPVGVNPGYVVIAMTPPYCCT